MNGRCELEMLNGDGREVGKGFYDVLKIGGGEVEG